MSDIVVLVELVAAGYSDKPDLGNAHALHEFIEFNGVQPFLDAMASRNLRKCPIHSLVLVQGQ